MASLQELALEVYRRIAKRGRGFRARRRYGMRELGGFERFRFVKVDLADK